VTLYNKNQSSDPLERPEIDYPCLWVYKVIGEDTALLNDVIVSACAPHEVKISYSHSSSNGKYHSLNAELEVPDEKFRLNVYETLKDHPAVKIVL
jgi:putative lipoic acid-binding regulatory protein